MKLKPLYLLYVAISLQFACVKEFDIKPAYYDLYGKWLSDDQRTQWEIYNVTGSGGNFKVIEYSSKGKRFLKVFFDGVTTDYQILTISKKEMSLLSGQTHIHFNKIN